MTAPSVEPFVHPALFYRGEEEYLHGTVPFVRDGLKAGEPVAVAVPGPNLAMLKAALGEDVAHVKFLDMTEAGRNPGRIIPRVLRAFADTHRHTRVRIIGEPIWAGRSTVEYPACVQHEALINPAFQGRDVTILCPYDADRLDGQVLTDAYATHPLIISGGRERPSTSYAPEHVVARYNQPLEQPHGGRGTRLPSRPVAGRPPLRGRTGLAVRSFRWPPGGRGPDRGRADHQQRPARRGFRRPAGVGRRGPGGVRGARPREPGRSAHAAVAHPHGTGPAAGACCSCTPSPTSYASTPAPAERPFAATSVRPDPLRTGTRHRPARKCSRRFAPKPATS